MQIAGLVFRAIFEINHPRGFWKCCNCPRFSRAISKFHKCIQLIIPNRPPKHVITTVKPVYTRHLWFLKKKCLPYSVLDFFEKKIILVKNITIFYVNYDSIQLYFLKNIWIHFVTWLFPPFLLIHLAWGSFAYLHEFQQNTSHDPGYQGLQILLPFYHLVRH